MVLDPQADMMALMRAEAEVEVEEAGLRGGKAVPSEEAQRRDGLQVVMMDGAVLDRALATGLVAVKE